MRVKKELHYDEVVRIVGTASKELTDKCPDQLVVFPARPCTNVACPYQVKNPGYMNCSFVAGEAGEHTLDAIAQMMNLTREGVRLIERRGLQKLRDGLEKLNAKKATAHQSRHVPGRGDILPLAEAHQRTDKGHVVPAVDDRKLDQRRG